MKETVNQKDRDFRGELLSRVKAKYPDRQFDEQMAQGGQGGQALEQAIMEMLDEGAGALEEMNSKNAQITKLFFDDPHAGDFIMEWMKTGDPRGALVRVFGDDLSSLATEEGRAAFGDQLSDYRSRKAQSAAMDEEASANWEESMNALEQFRTQHSLSEAQALEILIRLQKIASGALMNKYEPEDFALVLKEMNYDKDVTNARNEGLVAGRNEAIEARRAKRGVSEQMPASIGGRGMRSAEPQPKKPGSVWEGIK